MGRDTGITRGRDGNVHFGDWRVGCVGMVSTLLDKQFAVDPVKRADAYGFVGETVDGNDVEAMFEATFRARERALAGEGPTLIEALTMRMHGHAAHDDMKYVPKELVEEWRAR